MATSPVPRPARRGQDKPMGLGTLAFGFAGAFFLLGFALSIGGLVGTLLVLVLAASLGVAAYARGYDSRDGKDGTTEGPWKYV